MGVNGRSVASANCVRGVTSARCANETSLRTLFLTPIDPCPCAPTEVPVADRCIPVALELRSVRIADAGRSLIVAGTDRIHEGSRPDATESNRKQKNRPHTLADLRRHRLPHREQVSTGLRETGLFRASLGLPGPLFLQGKAGWGEGFRGGWGVLGVGASLVGVLPAPLSQWRDLCITPIGRTTPPPVGRRALTLVPLSSGRGLGSAPRVQVGPNRTTRIGVMQRSQWWERGWG